MEPSQEQPTSNPTPRTGSPEHHHASSTVLAGDALQLLATIADNSIDAVITDPPYAIKATRGVQERPRCDECANSATSEDSTECATCVRAAEIEGFAAAAMLGQQSANWHESATHSRGYADNDPVAFQRWCTIWLEECLRVLKPGGHLLAFGGTRTWHRLATAAEDVGFQIRDSFAWLYGTGFPKSVDVARAIEREHAKAHDAAPSVVAEEWRGWGTSVKPGHEPMVLARKPLAGTVASNVVRYGTGAMNVAGCRIGDPSSTGLSRWPTNVFLDDAQADLLDEQAPGNRPSRFFWVAKPSRAERVSVDGVAHPTVKPVRLMRELVRLVTPAGATVLDPFAGSGTTVEACVLEGRHCVAIERDDKYVPLILARVARASAVIEEPAAESTEYASAHPGGQPDLPQVQPGNGCQDDLVLFAMPDSA